MRVDHWAPRVPRVNSSPLVSRCIFSSFMAQPPWSLAQPFLAPQYTRERPQAVRVPFGLAVGADTEEGHDVAFVEGRNRVVLGEDVRAFVDVAGQRAVSYTNLTLRTNR